MAAKASASVRAAAANSGAAYAQMLAGATKPISIRSIALVARTAVATEVALARSFAVGTASAGNVATGLAHRARSQANVIGRVEYGWATSPTAVATGAAGYFRREVLAAATGARVELWRDEDGPIAIEPTGVGTGAAGLLLVNVGSAAGAALDVHVTWEYGPASDQ
jgi:uncharacterized membrane protein